MTYFLKTQQYKSGITEFLKTFLIRECLLHLILLVAQFIPESGEDHMIHQSLVLPSDERTRQCLHVNITERRACP